MKPWGDGDGTVIRVEPDVKLIDGGGVAAIETVGDPKHSSQPLYHPLIGRCQIGEGGMARPRRCLAMISRRQGHKAALAG